MSYVYDLVLNFNSEFYDFYEWKKDDDIYHIKRINLIKVNSKTYNDTLDNVLIFDNELLLSIFNRCEYYSNRNIVSLPYVFLITDTYRVMGIMLDNKGKTIKYSSLLLDEEEYVLDLCNKLADINISYRIVKKRSKNEYQTRQERFVLRYIMRDLNTSYQKKDLNKLKYLYYEYFNKQCDDIDIIYNELYQELKKEVSDKHYNLYNLIKLSYSGKTVQN